MHFLCIVRHICNADLNCPHCGSTCLSQDQLTSIQAICLKNHLNFEDFAESENISPSDQSQAPPEPNQSTCFLCCPQVVCVNNNNGGPNEFFETPNRLMQWVPEWHRGRGEWMPHWVCTTCGR